MTSKTRLNSYQLSCGYIERLPAANGASVTIWREHGCYHARRSDWHGNPAMWESASTVAAIRKLAATLCRMGEQR